MKQTNEANQENLENNTFVSGYLLYLLAAASDAVSAQFHVRVRECGLRVPEWRVLACLYDQDGEMITRLAEFALIEQSRLTRIINQMDTRGWVKRKADKEDKRRVRVYLTGKGRKLAEQLVAEAKAHEAGLLGELRNHEGENIKTVLRSIIYSCGTAPARDSAMQQLNQN